MLRERIKDLEHQNEILMGANQVLQEQLKLSQVKEGELLNKVFEVAGINKKEQVIPSKQNFNMIQLAKRGIPWSQVRHNLEMQAQEEYWKKKNQKQEQKENGDKEFHSSDNSDDKESINE